MKRLVVCCDGTWQDLNQKAPGNVVKIAQAIRPMDHDGIKQVVYYDDGIGCGSGIPLANKIEKWGGGIFGWGIDHKIQDAYRFLCLNYEPGDEIYLFGFSRGAYTVRSLSGLIYNSGLLQRNHLRKVYDAYELYRNRSNQAAPNNRQALQFRQNYCIQYCPPQGIEEIDQGRIPIKALCCWDTVCSLGLPNIVSFLDIDERTRKRYSFFNHHINRLVEFAFHAAAIDEVREAYNVIPMEPCQSCENRQQIRQVWFPGHHGCLGGGDRDLQGLSDAALVWMMDQVEPLRLSLDKHKIEGGIYVNYKTPFDHQPRGIDRFAPRVSRVVYGGFHALHQSVIQRWNDPDMNYQPKNLKAFEELLDAYGAGKANGLKELAQPSSISQ